MHLDGQGVDPNKWNQESQYKAVLKKPMENSFKEVSWGKLNDTSIDDYRIFARSSSDDKGPFLMLTTALKLSLIHI